MDELKLRLSPPPAGYFWFLMPLNQQAEKGILIPVIRGDPNWRYMLGPGGLRVAPWDFTVVLNGSYWAKGRALLKDGLGKHSGPEGTEVWVIPPKG